MSSVATLEQVATTFAGPVRSRCRACIVVPARNEEAGLPATLDALRLQTGPDGARLDADSYEVLLLLNNCTDGSASVAQEYARRHPSFALHVAEVSLPPEAAHVGTARRMLMDAACARMETTGGAILSTDADTLVAPDWVAANLAELQANAEVVGGVIRLFEEDYESLDEGTRLAYDRDRQYQALVARLEWLLDPDPADPWPRHVEHFGASLACTCEVYRRSGGLPPVKPLEDVAFIDALRKVGARIRHSPAVSIRTSARLDGRAEVGLSGQLRHWQRVSEQGLVHDVESAEWLEHRFRSIGALRRLHRQGCMDLGGFPETWRERLENAVARQLPVARFLEVLDCNRLIDETFRGERRGEITQVLRDLAELCARLPEPI